MDIRSRDESEWFGEPQLITKRNASGEYRLRKYSFRLFNVYSFGFLADKKNDSPRHGREWSSRAGIVNHIFGTELFEIAFNGGRCSLQKDDLEKLLPEGATINHNQHPPIESTWQINLGELAEKTYNNSFQHIVNF